MNGSLVPTNWTRFRFGSLAFLRAASLLGVLLLLDVGAVSGQFTLYEREGRSLEVGGYVRSLTQLYDPGYDIPGTDRPSGIHAEVVRLKWKLRLGDSFILEAHNRILGQVSSDPTDTGGSVVGFGVSAVPGRSVDLSSAWVEEDRLRVWHDIDRLSLTIYSGLGDLTVGRQAITWGISNLFPVVDLWAQFSPFELDTEEKPGIDAIRILSYPGDGLELDAVVADRGSSEDLSAGIRAGLSLSWADLYLGAGKFWNQAMGLAGISAPVGSWKVRAEGVLPYDLDEEDTNLPRMTLGLDWLGGEVMLSGEYHFNGIGAKTPVGYIEVLQDERFSRGESYFLGRHYLGGMGSWTPGNDRLSLSLVTLWNLQDPSSAFVPNLTYDVGQSTRISAGAMISFGDTPILAPPPTLRSEYGSYGDFAYTMLSVYF